MKKLIYMGLGLFLGLSAVIWTGCDKPNELEPDNGGDSLEKEYAEMQILDTNDNALSELYFEWVFKGAFKLKNSGNVVTTWEISEISEEWLECSKQGGELVAGAAERIDLLIDKSKLPSEEIEAVLYIVSAAGTIQLKVRVSIALPKVVKELSASMVYVDGGTFSMGATSEQGSDADEDEQPVHSVTLDGYYIGAFEITQAQWEAVMGTTVEQQRAKANASNLYGVGDNYPMYYVSWEEAVKFCETLSQMTGKTYRLPTEAEWEYAARGGENADGTKYVGGDNADEVAWYYDNSEKNTHPVGQKKPNGLDLYDMSGNLWEWCSDWYGLEYYNDLPSVNPQGPDGGAYRVLRGGSWYGGAQNCRVSNRNGGMPAFRSDDLGFRVVCER